MITKTLFVIKKKKKQRIQKLIFCETEKGELLDLPTTSHQDHSLGTYPFLGNVTSPYCSSFYICISQLSLAASLNS